MPGREKPLTVYVRHCAAVLLTMGLKGEHSPMRGVRGLLLVFALAGATLPVHSDVLLMEGIANEPPNSAEGLPRPARGISMERVLEQYGEPMDRIPAVGMPPISRWVYDGYTVYFEDQHTITSVISR